MSDRPTISIYADGQIINCLYMRNWPIDSLFLKCVEIAYRFDSADDKKDIRAFGNEAFNERANVHDFSFLEESSEYPVVIDFDRRLIYLKDEYPLGVPDATASVIHTVNEYDNAGKRNDVFPDERPISFDVCGYLYRRLSCDVPDGRVTAAERNEFISNKLPAIIDRIGIDTAS